ncbi:MAG: DUF3842 family protein [Clostridia bacterium]|nr:DUF3842 family protein [Clostridia bacterium]
MKLLITDGQGGKMGRQIAELCVAKFPKAQIVVVGTNTIATSEMLKSGVKLGATGENAVVVNCRDADVIIGPIGIVIADSMLGEITPKMALAVAQSGAHKVLIPSAKCNNTVAGVGNLTMSELITDAVSKTEKIITELNGGKQCL